VGYVEVYKQADGFATQLQVREELSLMDRRDAIYRLESNDHQILHEQINAIAELELHTVVDHREADLRVGAVAGLAEFVLESGSVGALQQARAKFGVNLHGGRDDGMADLLS
jgi:hypothetical protein